MDSLNQLCSWVVHPKLTTSGWQSGTLGGYLSDINMYNI